MSGFAVTNNAADEPGLPEVATAMMTPWAMVRFLLATLLVLTALLKATHPAAILASGGRGNALR